MQVHGAAATAQTHAAGKLKPEMARPASRPDKVSFCLQHVALSMTCTNL